MFRLVKLSGQWFGMKIRGFESDAPNISAFLEAGEVVVLAEDLESAADVLSIEVNDIQLVSPDKEE